MRGLTWGVLLAGGCTSEQDKDADKDASFEETGLDDTDDTDNTDNTDTGEDTGTPALCTDPDTDLGGEYQESRTLQRACSPYRLLGGNNYNGASFYGEGVVLTIEEGVQIVAEEGARLSVSDGALLLAGRSGGEPVHIGSDPLSVLPWAGLSLEEASQPHELHHAVLADAAGNPLPEGGDAALILWSGRALLQDVRIERPLDVGMRLYREPASLEAGSSGIVVEDAGGYPLVMDAQNLPSLPPDQELNSLDESRDRILLFGGMEGMIEAETLWQPQQIPLEIAVRLDIGVGSLVLPSRGTILLRSNAGIHVDEGTLVVEGEDPLCRADRAACTLVLDEAVPGEPWASIVFTSDASSPSGSLVANTAVLHGGNNEPSVYVIASSAPGDEGDCTFTTIVVDNWFESGGLCLAANDSQNEYGSDNSYHGCSADVRCD